MTKSEVASCSTGSFVGLTVEWLRARQRDCAVTAPNPRTRKKAPSLPCRRPISRFPEFLTLMRVRVPAARDMIELMSADILMNHMRRVDEKGVLPPRPAGLELSDIHVAIDPHMSIHALPKIIEGYVKIWDDLVFEIIHNRSGIPFITSDNPVIYFDPSVPERAMLPYPVRPPARTSNEGDVRTRRPVGAGGAPASGRRRLVRGARGRNRCDARARAPQSCGRRLRIRDGAGRRASARRR